MKCTVGHTSKRARTPRHARMYEPTHTWATHPPTHAVATVNHQKMCSQLILAEYVRPTSYDTTADAPQRAIFM